ncbi:MAG: hemerythrin domain-containing protein [Candidatus Sumerlaeota bacterium]|nr:hemerythrin domain-containing protein [Candidatus Sumerlaeota bacterium]
MNATDILQNEHRVIEQVLDCLETIAERAQQTGSLDKDDARSAVEFFRGFADRCHHGKEEAHLFPMMESRGFPREAGPVGVMLYEHDLGRVRVRGMDQAIDRAAAGDAQALRDFVENAQGYIALLRQHIQKEDSCLFPMANSRMNAQDQQQLLREFEKVEREEIGVGVHERFHAIADQLAAKYGPAKARQSQAAAAPLDCGLGSLR